MFPPVTTALKAHAQSMGRDGWDVTRAHVSDLASCRRAVAARRSGAAMLPHSLETRVKMEQGLSWERFVFSALSVEFMNVRFQTPYRFWFEGAELRSFVGNDQMLADAHPEVIERVGLANIIVGTSDFVVTNAAAPDERFVIDTKESAYCSGERELRVEMNDDKTRKFKQTTWEPERYAHLLATAAYAYAEGAQRFALLRRDPASGAIVDLDKTPQAWHRTEDWTAGVIEAARSLLDLTHPDGILPEPRPLPHTFQVYEKGRMKELGFSLECYICDFGECPENKNKMRDTFADLLEVV